MMGTSGEARDFCSIVVVTDTPVLANGSYWKYSDSLGVGGFSAACRKWWASGNHAEKPMCESIRHGDRHCCHELALNRSGCQV
jgi:hypothetical protein